MTDDSQWLLVMRPRRAMSGWGRPSPRESVVGGSSDTQLVQNYEAAGVQKKYRPKGDLQAIVREVGSWKVLPQKYPAGADFLHALTHFEEWSEARTVVWSEQLWGVVINRCNNPELLQPFILS
ncbi:hypothetical protein [Deinococcus altitudinis]|uniref:hypothetical protein n=1 Tax=Deinococcus altitudinis TaxID=468914 RepID=UPI003891E853